MRAPSSKKVKPGYHFRKAVEQGNLTEIGRLLKQGYTPDTGLVYAIDQRKPSLVRYFLKHGANPSVKFGSRPAVVLAISKGDVHIVDMLLKAKAKPVKEALDFAVKTGNEVVVEMLLKAGGSQLTVGPRLVKWAYDHGLFSIYTLLVQKRPRTNIEYRLPKCTALRVDDYSREDVKKSPTKMLAAVDDLRVCEWAESIEDDIRDKAADGYFFAYDARGKCVAGASVEISELLYRKRSKILYVRYLCSSKTCAGAGSFLMRHMERMAKGYGFTFVGLTSSNTAKTFYPKLGFVRVAGNMTTAGNNAMATRSQFRRFSQFIKRVK
jgi:GNAT superfamily N-acetyltransferase